MNIVSEIRQFLQDKFPDKFSNLTPDTILITSGLMDSFDILELLEFTETKFGVSFENNELAQENFDSIGALEKLIAKKL